MMGKTCGFCKYWGDYGYCTVCSTKPPVTGDPKTCPYFKKR